MNRSRVFSALFMTTFLSATCTAQLSEVLMLTLSSSSRSDQTAIRFLDEATDSFDSEYDAYKFINPSPTPNIYTVSDENYSINALNKNFSEKVVALHVKLTSPEPHTITTEEIGEFGDSWRIFLIDHLLNQTIDLRRTGSYNFYRPKK